jgi:tRNA(Ile)-lysidine synthase
MQRGSGSGVIQRFLAFLDDQGLTGTSAGIAFSGGRDSSALAICATEARNADRLIPILVHVDHGVRQDSSEDRDIVRQSAAVLDAELRSIDIKSLSTQSTEAEMREARYLALHSILAPLGITTVLTGHHARDQAETVLLHLARGQGLEGATGISPVESLRFGAIDITVIRPFLHEDPVALADLVAGYGLPIVEDKTNALVDRARNLVRHQVLPVLCEINPGAVMNIARSTEILREENQTLVVSTSDTLRVVAGDGGLNGAGLSDVPVAIQRRVIRAWVRQQTGIELTFDRTEALRLAANAGTGNVVLEIGDGWTARQIRRTITLQREK